MAETTYRIAVIAGDGIGPEIMREGVKVLAAALARARAPRCILTEARAGAELYRDTGVAFPDESRRLCQEADAVYFGASGLPEVQLPDGTGVSIAWDLRKGLNLFAGIRPIRLFHPRLSPLRDLAAGAIRFTIVRENTEGIYASRWAGTLLHDEVAVNPIVITRRATERIMRVAFDLARRSPAAPRDGRRRVTCVDKSNVLTSWALFRRIFDEVGEQYPDVERDYCYVDAMSLLLVQQPGRFQIVVTENQHGDILSDLGAALVGGLGFAPSANIGETTAMFEPAHGTAPSIAGKSVANPVATILSGAMLLDWLGATRAETTLVEAARLIEAATATVLAGDAVRTADMGGDASTAALGDTIARAVEAL